MADLVFVILTVAFFAAGGADREGGRAAVSVENAVGLIVAVLLLGYLVRGPAVPGAFLRCPTPPPACCRSACCSLALAAVLPPARRLHGPGLRAVSTTPRVERVIYRVIGVDPKADQRWPVYARGAAGVLRGQRAGPVRAPAVPAAPAAVPRLPRRRAGPGVQHRRLVRDQHQLAVVLGRVDDGPPGADGRPRRAELRLRRGRHGGRGRAGPRVLRVAHRPARQLLGRPGPRLPAHPAADRRARRARRWSRWARCRTSPSGTDGDHRRRAVRRRSPAARWPPRR